MKQVDQIFVISNIFKNENVLFVHKSQDMLSVNTTKRSVV